MKIVTRKKLMFVLFCIVLIPCSLLSYFLLPFTVIMNPGLLYLEITMMRRLILLKNYPRFWKKAKDRSFSVEI